MVVAYFIGQCQSRGRAETSRGTLGVGVRGAWSHSLALALPGKKTQQGTFTCLSLGFSQRQNGDHTSYILVRLIVHIRNKEIKFLEMIIIKSNYLNNNVLRIVECFC